MTAFEKRNRIVAATVFLGTFLVYLKTVSPTVSFWDCGEFITTSYIFGVPHPPGAPFYTLLGRIFSLLPFGGEIAFRVNLISVLSGATTVLLIYLCAVRLLSSWLDPGKDMDQVAIFTGGAVAAFSTAFSTSFWANSSEAEVYGLSMCFTLLAFWLALRWDDGHKDRQNDRLLLLIAYLFGLGAGVHLQCLLTVPGILILVFTDLMTDRAMPVGDQILCVVGLTLYPFLAILLPLPQAFASQAVLFSMVLSVAVALIILRPAWRPSRFWLWGALIGLGFYFAYYLVYLVWFGTELGLERALPYSLLMTLAVLAALMLLRPAWRNPWFWLCGAVIAGLGFSTYLALTIRSGLNPIIDMNDPETWENFKAFMARQQYGTHSLFPRRGDVWSYQINIFIKYFLEEFPFYDTFVGAFRRAVKVYVSDYENIAFSVIPLFFGIGGAVYHLRKDWKRFASIFAMFALMGIGLVLYLNMPDPEPRERNYIFVGAYTFFGLWMGIGAAGLIASAGRALASVPLTGAIAAATLLLPVGILHNNFFSHDRTGDYIAHDYAYNILQTCVPNAILFTNGDNDTYPLWFLQYVKGIRTDVRIVNLSLIKTPWYVRQLRDLEPRIPIPFDDGWIGRNVTAQPWTEGRDAELTGLTVKAEDIPTAYYYAGNTDRRVQVVEAHTWMIWLIVQQNNWERPIYFAVTVPTSNMAGLRPYMSMEGMAYRLVRTRGMGQFNTERTAQNLLDVYRYEGVADSGVYKDPVARRLLSNYLVLFEGLSRAYLLQGQNTEAYRVLQQAETLIPPHALDNPATWGLLADRYRELAVKFAEADRADSALHCMEELIRLNPNMADRAKVEELIRTWKERIEGGAQNEVKDSSASPDGP